MAILTAQQSVNTRDLPELENVVNGTFSGSDPDGGWQLFGTAEVGFVYPNPATLEIRFVSQANDFALAAQALFQGTASGIEVRKANVTQWQLTGFTPFDINDLYADATNGLPTFPALLFAGDDELNGSPFGDILYGFAGEDLIEGDDGDDQIDGGVDDDVLRGGDGNDQMDGGDGEDDVIGGKGADGLAGGFNADAFIFLAVSDSTKKATGRDTVLDFNGMQGDEIDLSAIDAKKGGGNQGFTFIKKQGFHEKKGELRYKVKDGDVHVQGDIDGNGKADFAIVVADLTKLTAGDFEL